MELFEKFYDNLSKRPNRILYSDSEKDYSSLDIEKISGKVYCYLCSHNIGREDIVLIHLKRSAKIAFVFYGTLKAGACAVIVDGDANKEYFDYFCNDSKPDLIIDENTYNEILNYDYQKGNKEPNEHDAAFIVYTSSSTAKPKGCIHEYGDIDLHLSCIKSPDMMAYVFKERIAFVAEFYDIASITTLFDVIYGESYLYVIQRDFVRNKEKLFKIIKEHNLTTSIMMPRFIDENLLSTLPSLDYIYVAFEVIEKMFVPGFPIYNIYGMSEYVLSVAMFLIDKAYDITPVGPLNPIGQIRLVDENDRTVKTGEIGEIVFPNPYFRGYLNMPQETLIAMRNGIYHTKDMGYINEDGNLVILGRYEDLLKTSQGYIVPLFVQVELKKLLSSNEICVRAFQNGENNHVVVYYLESLSFDKNIINDELLKKIPEFMLPTDYIPLKELPLLTSGKINREYLKNIFFEYISKKSSNTKN